MKIAFFELEGWEEKFIAENFPQDQLFLNREKVNEFSLPPENDFEIVSIFVDSEINAKVLPHFPKLKFLTTRSTGYDHIDLNVCKKRGVAVAYVPGYGDNTVAEFAFGLILSLTRKIYQAIDRIKENGSFSLKDLRGIDLKGKTIGVVGTGRIGKEAIKIAQGFGMKILAFDPMPDKNFQKSVGFDYVAFDDLLKNADIITIHCPFNEKTHHLINKENIELIKPGAFLINTARGEIVETEALVYGLRMKILGGVALDVLEEEGEVKDELNFLTKEHPKEKELKNMLYNHILMEMPNVLITPHNAFNSEEAIQRILSTTVENIKSFAVGKPANLLK